MSASVPPELSEAELESLSPPSLLSLAAALGRTDLLVSALRSGAPVDSVVPTRQDPSISRTALQTAITHNRVDCARALLAAGATIDPAPASRTTLNLLTAADSPALTAVFTTHLCQKAATADLPAVHSALLAGLDPDAADSPETGNTPLHWAASFGQLAAVDALLAAGAAHSPVNAAHATPLIDAARAAHVPVVRALVTAGADPFLAPNEGRAAVDVATNDEVLGALHRRRAPKPPPATPAVEPAPAYTPAPPTPYFVPGEAARSSAFARDADAAPDWLRLLWPVPQRVRVAHPAASFTVPPVVTVSAAASAMHVARHFISWLRHQRVLPEGNVVRLMGGGQGGLAEPNGFSAAIFLRVDGHVVEREQAYNLAVRDFGIDVVGGDLQGLFYGCARLCRVLRLCGGAARDGAPLSVPAMCISDWPSVRRRGLYLDVSGDRLPTMETFKELVMFMSSQMNMDQLQLNIGRNVERMDGVSQEGALRHEDVLELSDFCKDHFVELIPVIAQDASLVSTMGDLHVTRNGDSEGFVHEARKKEQMEREKLFDEFLPLFESEQVNVGELTQQAACDFSDFERLRSISNSLRTRGKRTVQVFGDKIAPLLSEASSASGALAELPAHSIVILEAKDADNFTFQQHCLQVRQHGLAIYTCASSFLGDSIAGRLSAALNSTRVAVEAALMEGASGVLLKDTSLKTYGGPLVLLYQLLVPFAGASWNERNMIQESAGRDEILSHLYDTYLFNDPVDKGMLGSIAVVLGDLHMIANDRNGGALFDLLTQQNADLARVEEMTYLGLRRALKRAEKIENALSSYKGNASSIDVYELRACAILLSAAGRMGSSLLSASSAASMDSEGAPRDGNVDIRSLPDERRSDLCNVMLEAIDLLRDSWMQRYSTKGFAETVDYTVGRALLKLASGMPYETYLRGRKEDGWSATDD